MGSYWGVPFFGILSGGLGQGYFGADPTIKDEVRKAYEPGALGGIAQGKLRVLGFGGLGVLGFRGFWGLGV